MVKDLQPAPGWRTGLRPIVVDAALEPPDQLSTSTIGEKSIPHISHITPALTRNGELMQKMVSTSLTGPKLMDRLDRMILTILQEDATVPVAEIGRRVGLSTTPCWRRIQKMEEEGVIKGRVAVLDPKQVNAKVTVFVFITTNQHNEDWLTRFSRVISEFPEVVEFYRMSGHIDYLLKVVVPDIEAYDNFYKKLVAKIDIMDVSSAFAMESIKNATALPLGYMQLEPMAKQRS
jgi:Lrp/AsnC family transcriptional regulator